MSQSVQTSHTLRANANNAQAVAMSGDFYDSNFNINALFARGGDVLIGTDVVGALDDDFDTPNVIQMDADVLPSNVRLMRSMHGRGVDLIIMISGGIDHIVIPGYFSSGCGNPMAGCQIAFANGTMWDHATAMRKTMTHGLAK